MAESQYFALMLVNLTFETDAGMAAQGQICGEVVRWWVDEVMWWRDGGVLR